MRCIDMGVNLEPSFESKDENRRKLALEKKDEIILAMEEDGEVRLSWSCEGRTRHEMHSYQWKQAMKDYGWNWEIGYNYDCIVRK